MLYNSSFYLNLSFSSLNNYLFNNMYSFIFFKIQSKSDVFITKKLLLPFEWSNLSESITNSNNHNKITMRNNTGGNILN